MFTITAAHQRQNTKLSVLVQMNVSNIYNFENILTLLLIVTECYVFMFHFMHRL